jgi:hypothetical protein
MAHLFLSNAFKGGAGVTTLFSTHPSTAERVQRLERMAAITPQASRRGLQPGLAGQADRDRLLACRDVRSSRDERADGLEFNPTVAPLHPIGADL